MPRTARYNDETIGRELVAARAASVRWKDLEKRYNLSRTRLWSLWRQAKDAMDERERSQKCS